jgi:hypothetical protein
MLVELESACKRLDLETIRQLLIRAVDGFNPESFKDDLLWPSTSSTGVTSAISNPINPLQTKVAATKVTPLHKR